MFHETHAHHSVGEGWNRTHERLIMSLSSDPPQLGKAGQWWHDYKKVIHHYPNYTLNV